MRLLPLLLVLLALVVAPFGRVAAAEAMAMPRHAPAAMAGHCRDMPASDHGSSDQAAVDCMIACAVMTAPVPPVLGAVAPLRSVPVGFAPRLVPGLHPEADPPPPRIS